MERALKVVPFVPLVILLVGFWREIILFMRWFFLADASQPDALLRAIPIVLTIFFALILFFLIWLFIVAGQTIFPVTRMRQALYTAIYLILHFLGKHGVAAYVRNGRIKAFVDELNSRRPGAVVVDFNSAVAVEQIVLPRGFRRNVTDLIRVLLSLIGVNLPPIRIHGSGLLFMLPDERIHGVNDLDSPLLVTEDPSWMERILGVVDLRPQFRISVSKPHPLSKRLGTSVLAYTRDGIEVKTNIWVIATIGQEPVPYFPLNVTYIGEQHPRNLRVVRLRSLSENLYRVESFSDDLDQWDCIEIHEQIQRMRAWVAYQNTPSAPTLPVFNPARVFAAVYARARHHGGLGGKDEIIPWVDLPVHVGVDLFREIISHFNYDEIYFPVNGRIRIGEVRGKLASAMRNSCLLSWRPLMHRNGEPLRSGERYLATDLLTVLPGNAFVLQNSKILRDRGIRVIASGFGDLAVDERIYKQRLDNWRANWDKDTEIVEAGLEWEALKVRTNARIQAQQDFVQRLTQIYQMNANSREILAMRVLQALELAASDPKTRQFLPEDTFSMLNSIRNWLLPQDMGYSTDV